MRGAGGSGRGVRVPRAQGQRGALPSPLLYSLAKIFSRTPILGVLLEKRKQKCGERWLHALLPSASLPTYKP